LAIGRIEAEIAQPGYDVSRPFRGVRLRVQNSVEGFDDVHTYFQAGEESVAGCEVFSGKESKPGEVIAQFSIASFEATNVASASVELDDILSQFVRGWLFLRLGLGDVDVIVIRDLLLLALPLCLLLGLRILLGAKGHAQKQKWE
jgi:hypothetical protein